jgi:hypothetical protein
MPARTGLAGVLRAFGPAWLATHALTPPRAKVWRAITACRTAALGGRVESCADCGYTRHVYLSCRNRHCPLCQTRAKEAWLAARGRECLPAPYFHLVFTLPHALNALIAQRPRELYEMLFQASAATLNEFAADPRHLGGTSAFTLVLHTWKQDLGRHVHVHALMAGGALTADGQWQAAKRGFLFPVRALSRVFRARFMAALDRLREHSPDLAGWRALRRRLYAHDWVVYAKQPLGGPQAVLDYLARYTHRVAISNERILGIEHGQVAFRVRGEAGKRRTLRLPGAEFIDRFLKHVLPEGFKRIRHYGLLAPAKKAGRLALARAALDAPSPAPAVIESVEAFLHRVAKIEACACPACQGRLRVVAVLAPVRYGSVAARGPPP